MESLERGLLIESWPLIAVDRDRTLHVEKRFEIFNDSGVFDGEFHRRLWIKPVNPQRVKAGSFESVCAKVDGHDAALRTNEDCNVFDIRIATEVGTLSPGDHVIDLSYTAKDQFAIFDNFKDHHYASKLPTPTYP